MKSFFLPTARREPAEQAQPNFQWWPRTPVFARTLYVVLAAITLMLVAISLPTAFQRMELVCTTTSCRVGQLTVTHARELTHLGLSPHFFATYVLVWSLLFLLTSVAVSGLVVWRAGDGPMVLFVACVLLTLGTTGIPGVRDILSTSSFPVRVAARGVLFLGSVASVLLIWIFPDGRFVPRWMRWFGALFVLLGINAYFFRDGWVGRWLTSAPGRLLALAVIVAAVSSQVYRYRRVSSVVQRQQTKWVVWGMAVGMLGSQAIQAGLGFLPNLPILVLLLAVALLYSLICLIPLSFGVALLRYRLWDVDPLINRTLMYGLLTGVVVGLYILVVGSLSLLFQTRGNMLVALLATGVIAVLVQPLRIRIQRGVNHLLYGERDEPYAVLARLGRRLEATLAANAVLPTIVETVRETLKLPYVAIAIDHDGACATAAAAGTPVAETVTLPLVHHGETLGMFILGVRAPGETFTRADQRLLEELARQAGTAAHALRLSTDLQRSRERLVLAREEERRRLRNDLHDGLAPTLATLALAASNVVDAIPHQPVTAVALASDLEQQLRATVGDVRRMVYGLRPPALDELGLVAALRECARQATRYRPGTAVGLDRLEVVVTAPDDLPVLPAAVEVATYRITQEALHNVVKHAQARTCVVRLSLAAALHVEISDDGLGLPAEHQRGVGLQSMRERAAELGGTCVVEAQPGGGTRVRASLPVATA